MNHLIAQAIVIAVGPFSAGLMIISIRERDATPVSGTPRPPSRREQSDATPASLFQFGRS